MPVRHDLSPPVPIGVDLRMGRRSSSDTRDDEGRERQRGLATDEEVVGLRHVEIQEAVHRRHSPTRPHRARDESPIRRKRSHVDPPQSFRRHDPNLHRPVTPHRRRCAARSGGWGSTTRHGSSVDTRRSAGPPRCHEVQFPRTHRSTVGGHQDLPNGDQRVPRGSPPRSSRALDPAVVSCSPAAASSITRVTT